jgi:hypothetical protein
MRKSRFTEEQIIQAIKRMDAGLDLLPEFRTAIVLDAPRRKALRKEQGRCGNRSLPRSRSRMLFRKLPHSPDTR